jgi:hypothetical protein
VLRNKPTILGLAQAISELPPELRTAAEAEVKSVLKGNALVYPDNIARSEITTDGGQNVLKLSLSVELWVDRFVFIAFIWTKAGQRSVLIVRARHHSIQKLMRL